MKQNHLKKVPYIEQMRQTECGLCCVAMILQYYKSFDGIRKIRKNLDVGRDGLKLSLLADYLKSRGMETRVFKAPAEFLENFHFPAVVFWNQEHFVVLERVNKGIVTIVDPSYGRSRMKMEEFKEHYSDIIMTVEPTEAFHPNTNKRNLWKESFRNLKINKKLLGTIIVSSGIVYLLQLMIPLLVEQLIDKMNENSLEKLYGLYFPVVVGIAILYGIGTFYRGQKMLKMQLDVDHYLTQGTFRKLLNLPYKFFESHSNGDLLFRLSCLSNIRDLISEQLVQGLIQLGMLVFILCYMMSKSFVLTGIALVILILNVAYTVKMRKVLMEMNQYAVRANTKVQGVQVETVYSMFGIKISGMGENVKKTWDHFYEESVKAHRKKSLVQNLNDTVIKVLQMAGPMILLVAGVFLCQKGLISVGEILAVYAFSGNLFSASCTLFGIWNDFSLASSYLERVSDIMETEEEKEPEDPVVLDISGDIQLKNVSFSYNRHSGKILKDVNLEIRPGEKVAIVGTSGSGKSTLSKILLGLYDANDGEILYDGTKIEQLDKKSLRKQIGVVPQDMSLFNKTIYENITMNKLGISEEDVRKAVRVTQLEEEIESMPMKYDTLVSDMGMNLSGGQRQRVALARALINHPRVLILDEATSALDYKNEREISDYLEKIGCARIIIAHRLSTIVDSDKIVVLCDGEVKEIGNHQELLEKKGIYSSLYQSQMGNGTFL